jgi:hypothetical protein
LPWPREARHLALVGWPLSGKSTVAEILVDEFGGVIVDDGLILRKALPILTGIPEESCFSQEGKASVVQVGDRPEVVRQGLGELGKWMEGRYGKDVMPLRAMQLAQQTDPGASFYIYPSVRMEQGRVYRRHGGVVIQINNPTVKPSANDFDRWDPNCVDMEIENDPSTMSKEDLREFVLEIPGLLALV